MSASIDSVSPTVATASAPSRETQNTSTRANTDSSTISSTIGTASRRMARPIGPSVKSCRVPRKASQTEGQKAFAGTATAATDSSGTSNEALMIVRGQALQGLVEITGL